MQDISSTLIKLSQIVLKTTESSKLKLSKMILKQLDCKYFTEGYLMQVATFSELSSQMSQYYFDKFDQQIRESLFYSTDTDEKFVCIFKLILDLALNSDQKELYLNSILSMDENDKDQLMEFVADVVKREEFIDFEKEDAFNFTPQNSQLSVGPNFSEDKYTELKENYSELEKKYLELLDLHEAAKAQYEKVQQENAEMKQEKLQLLAELGLHRNSGYIEIVERYRKDVAEFHTETERLSKQLEEVNQNLKNKERQISDITETFSRKSEERELKLQQQQTKHGFKIESLEKANGELKERESELEFEVAKLKGILIDLKKQIEEKSVQIEEQGKTVQKFNQMKRLHLDFRKAMITHQQSSLVS